MQASSLGVRLHRALEDQPAMELLDFIRHNGNPLDAYQAPAWPPVSIPQLTFLYGHP